MDNFNTLATSRLLVTLWLMLAGVLAYAQQAAPLPESVTAEELADLVVERNPGVAALQAALDAANASVESAGALDDPMLSYAIAPRTIDSELNDRHLVSLSQALPWPGVLGLRTAVAQSERDAVSETIDELQWQVRSAAKAAYADWYFIHRALAYNEKNQQLLRELIEVAVTTYGAGRGAQQDVVGAQLREVELAQEALLLQRQRQAIAARIRGLLAASADTAIPAPGAFEDVGELAQEAYLVAQALRSNPALQAMRHKLHAAAGRVGLAEKDFYPNFKLNAAYVGTLDPREKRSQVGVALNLPLNRSKRRAEVDRRQAEHMALQFRLEDAAAAVTASLGDAYAQWQQARATEQLLKVKILPLAQQNLSATRADYSSGSGDFRAVIDAETRLLRIQTLLARNQADQWVARANMERLTGNGLEKQQ